MDQERVELFTGLLAAGEELPPIDVVPIGDGTYLIADGVHRTNAAVALNQTMVDVIILTLQGGESVSDCVYRRALETATRSALPLTKAERRRAVVRLLDRQPDLSHRTVARLVGVSHDTVDRWAKEAKELIGNGADSASTEHAQPSTAEIARRLVRTLIRLDDARGLLDTISPSRMGKHLAKAFRESLGDDALGEARRLAEWVASAVSELEGR